MYILPVIGSRFGIRNTLLFHLLTLTSYRYCLPDVFSLTAKRQCGPAGCGMFLVHQPTTPGLILSIQKKDGKGCKLFLPVSTPF